MMNPRIRVQRLHLSSVFALFTALVANPSEGLAKSGGSGSSYSSSSSSRSSYSSSSSGSSSSSYSSSSSSSFRGSGSSYSNSNRSSGSSSYGGSSGSSYRSSNDRGYGKPRSSDYSSGANSKRNSDSSVSERLRSVNPPPAYVRAARTARTSSESYTPRESGLLDPTPTNIVLSPAYFWLPMNIWHQGSNGSSPVYKRSSGSYSLPELEANDYVRRQKSRSDNELYQEGEVGANEVNELPEWIQASLRLMHTQQQSAFISDVVITPTASTESQWGAINKEKLAAISKLEALVGEYEAAKEMVIGAREADKTIAGTELLIKSETNKIAELVEKIQAANEGLKKAQLSLEDSQNRISAAKKTLSEAVLADGMFCKAAIHWCSQNIKDKETELVNLQTSQADKEKQLTAAQSSLESLVQTKSVREDWKRHYESDILNLQQQKAAAKQIPQNQNFALDIKSAKQKILNLWKEIENSAGFVELDPNSRTWFEWSQKNCGQKMYLYKYDPEVPPTQHPLFKESVEPELLPQDEGELVVCLDSQHRVKSVHILSENKEVIGSKIERAKTGEIKRLSIMNEDGGALEEHSWEPNADQKTTTYSLRFIEGDNVVSIRTDIPEIK